VLPAEFHLFSVSHGLAFAFLWMESSYWSLFWKEPLMPSNSSLHGTRNAICICRVKSDQDSVNLTCGRMDIVTLARHQGIPIPACVLLCDNGICWGPPFLQESLVANGMRVPVRSPDIVDQPLNPIRDTVENGRAQ
jgi:hypothetical protein